MRSQSFAKRAAVLLLFGVLLSLAGFGQAWVKLSPIGEPPTVKNDAVVTVYDPSSNRLITFGGITYCCTNFNDVWVLTNANGLGGTPERIKLNPAGPQGFPAPRGRHSAVYDSNNNRMIIFGGGNFTGDPACNFCIFDPLFNDVWVLTNANGLGGTPTWIPLFPSGGPPAPRAGHRAVYDPATNRMTVFGGGNNGIMIVPNDVWVLTNANGLGGTPEWVQLAPIGQIPPPLEAFAIGYDNVNNIMTVFGGCCTFTNATYTLTHANGLGGTPQWTQLTIPDPIPSVRGTWDYGYNALQNKLVIFGEGAFGGVVHDTWVLKNANGFGVPSWFNTIPDGALGSPPVPDTVIGGTYDAADDRLILVRSGPDVSPAVGIQVWVLGAPVLSTPQIVAVSPATVSQGQGNVTLTITGVDFQSGSTVSISNPGIPIVSQQPPTATQIIATISVASGAQLGPTNVTVTNPDGGQTTVAGAITVLVLSAQAGPPPITIASISPATMTRGQTIPTFIVTGQNFGPNATLSFSGSGISVAYASRTATQITAAVTTTEDATLGAIDVTVTNPDSQLSGTLPGGLLVKRKPVIVIPGIMGSVLRQKNSPNAVIWGSFIEDATSSTCNSKLLALALADDGVSPKPPFTFECPPFPIFTEGQPIEATGLLIPSAGADSDFYQKLLDTLTTPGESFDVIQFPYDWRLDFDTAAEALGAKISELAPNSWDRVDIVAHSQGGLVVETYLANKLLRGEATDNRIGKIIFLGTPHRGATKAFATLKGWVEYDAFFATINDINNTLFPSVLHIKLPIFNYSTMVFIGKTFPAVYELLPRYSFMSTDGVLEDFETTYLSDNVLRLDLLHQSSVLWNSLGAINAAHPQAIAINGTAHNTLLDLRHSTASDCLVPVADPTGDGTVPTLSSSALPATTYFYVDAAHADLPNNPAVDDAVFRLLNGTDPTRLLEQFPDINGLSATPTATIPVTAYTCSPVRMRVADALGNVDGFDDQGHLLREIPNSDFFKFDTTEGVLLEANDYSVNLAATNAGTFSVVFNLGGDPPNSTIEFHDVPISFHSKARLAFTPGSSSLVLQLDVNGDGITDFDIASGHPAPAGSFVAVLQNILPSLGLGEEPLKKLTHRLAEAAEELGELTELKDKLLKFREEVQNFAQKGLLSNQQETLLAGIADKVLGSLGGLASN